MTRDACADWPFRDGVTTAPEIHGQQKTRNLSTVLVDRVQIHPGYWHDEMWWSERESCGQIEIQQHSFQR
jgi:hypothetical protein